MRQERITRPVHQRARRHEASVLPLLQAPPRAPDEALDELLDRIDAVLDAA